MESALVVENLNDDVELADGDPETAHASVIEVPGVLRVSHCNSKDHANRKQDHYDFLVIAESKVGHIVIKSRNSGVNLSDRMIVLPLFSWPVLVLGVRLVLHEVILVVADLIIRHRMVFF